MQLPNGNTYPYLSETKPWKSLTFVLRALILELLISVQEAGSFGPHFLFQRNLLFASPQCPRRERDEQERNYSGNYVGFDCDNDRGNYEGDQVHNLNHRVQGGACCIFERITNRVTNYARLVTFATFTGIRLHVSGFVLNRLLGVIPRSTSIRHENGEQLPRHYDTCQQPTPGF